jgi:acetyl-CoA carboxylase biotin carboxyl carrier protein
MTMEIDLDQIKALADLAQENNLAELTVTDGPKTVTIKTVSGNAPVVYQQSAPQPASQQSVQAAPVAQDPQSAPTPAHEVNPNLVHVTAPMVGTFYRSPSPDAPPFTDVGQTIRVGQTLCIIEAMKLMNELESDVSGKVVRVLVENGQPVEFGQPLFEVEKA